MVRIKVILVIKSWGVVLKVGWLMFCFWLILSVLVIKIGKMYILKFIGSG